MSRVFHRVTHFVSLVTHQFDLFSSINDPVTNRKCNFISFRIIHQKCDIQNAKTDIEIKTRDLIR